MGNQTKRTNKMSQLQELTNENRKKLLISQCKREAKHRTKTSNLTHMQHLDEIAKELGAHNWKDYLNKL